MIFPGKKIFTNERKPVVMYQKYNGMDNIGNTIDNWPL